MFSRTQQATILTNIKAESLEFALYTTNPTATDIGVECSGGGYARQPIAFGANATVADGTQCTNTGVITFPQASSDWNAPAAYWAVRIVGGALVSRGELKQGGVATTRTVRTGDTYQQGVGTVTLKVSD